MDGAKGSRHGRRRDSAQAGVEFVLMFPFVLLLFLALIEFGFLMFTSITVNNAAHEAARYGAVGNPVGNSNCDSGIKERVILVGNGIVECSEVDVKFIDIDGDSQAYRGDSVVVKINHEYTTITPIAALASAFSLGTIDTTVTISACSDARLQAPTQEVSPDLSGTDCG